MPRWPPIQTARHPGLELWEFAVGAIRILSNLRLRVFQGHHQHPLTVYYRCASPRTGRDERFTYEAAILNDSQKCGLLMESAKFETGIKCGLDVEVNKARLTGPF
jgi:hypothetical protein